MTKRQYACVVCLKKLEGEKFNNRIRDSIGIVYEGLICRTNGNYGSLIYDDTTGNEYVEFVVCDRCAKKRAKYMVRVIVERRETKVVSAGRFCPETKSELARIQSYKEARKIGKLIVGVPAAKKVTLWPGMKH